MLSLEARTLLRRVRARVDDEWGQDSYDRGVGMKHRFCLVGLLRHESGYGYTASGIPADYKEAYEAIYQTIANTCGALGIEGWNDRPLRTPQQVKVLIDDTLRIDVFPEK